ncbi:MAG: hypothetical protein ACI857_001067 [Arenicella sp.]|jgi:hypothetical protein
MKKLILISAITAVAFAGFSTFTGIEEIELTPFHPKDPRSGGAAAILGQDRTGGPLSVGTCAACHSPTGSTTMISAVLKDEFSTSVTSYDAGEDYSMEFTVINNLYNNFGFQANALTSTNGQGGDFTSVISSNTQISNVAGIEYPEHLGAKSGVGSTTFIVNWVAPTNGTGTIDVFGIGMGVNLNFNTTGDAPGAGGGGGSMLSLTENPPTLIAYSMATYCTSDAPDLPAIAGNFTGTFSSSPTGLTIDFGSGEITPSTSTPGNYVIDYIYGTGAGSLVSTVVEIIGSDASFDYGSTNYCQADSDPTANIIGDVGGTFTGPAGVVFLDVNTGEIDLDASTTGGPYTITYSLSAPCVDVQTYDITIDASDDPSFAYAASYCQSDADPTAGSIATPGGLFTGPGGVVFTNSTTGQIDLGASTAGSYTITYNTNGVCPDLTSQDVVIGEEYVESIGATICEDGTYLFGTTLLDSSNAGLVSQSYTSIYGCDSLVNLTLSVTTVDSTVTLASQTLTATESGATYQWLDCDDSNSAIAGATSQDFTPTSNGNYAVQVSIGTCIKISECTEVSSIGFNENQTTLISLYPNPASSQIALEGLAELKGIQSISIVDLNGKIVSQLAIDEVKFDISSIADGIYQIVITHENGIEKLRLIKE